MGFKRKILDKLAVELTRVAVPYYSEEDYERLRTLADDPESLSKTYIDFIVAFAAEMDKLRGEGLNPVLTLIEVDELHQWCIERGVPLNEESRALFASEEAIRWNL